MAEILKIREITIDTMQHKEFNVKEEELKLIRFYQNDLNSAKLLINVTHDKVVTDFSSATSVQIAFLKPDCKRVFQDVQNVNQMQGKYYVVLSTQTLIAYGNVIAQLRFTFPNNKVIETCKFAFTVDESIMSDDAMKSTNEFPVIQKAIEAGKKLEGVDIDGIIAAGELAKGALPKTGGTLTGTLNMQASIGFEGDRNLYRKDSSGTFDKGFILNNTNIKMHDWKNNRTVWDYEQSNNMFNMIANTNLVKKSEAYTDLMLPQGTPKPVPAGVDMNTVTESGTWQANGNPNLPNVNSQWFIVEVFRHTVSYVVQRATRFATSIPETYERTMSAGTWGGWYRIAFIDEVARKTGDTFTGHMVFRGNLNHEIPDGLKGVNIVVNSSVNKWAIAPKMDGTPVWANEFAMDLNTGKVTVPSLATRKDGRASITLNSGYTNFDNNYPVIADRRGNTVTLRGAVRRDSGTSSDIAFTLPKDMFPLVNLPMNLITNEGVSVRVIIATDGTVKIGSQNSAVYISFTYVVN